jgi:EpsI family protein
MAEGLIHQVQGWMMFMLSTGILLFEVKLLSSIGHDRRPWREQFGLQPVEAAPATLPRRTRALSLPLLICAAAVLLFSVAARALPANTERVPMRESFATFPLQVSDWSGQRQPMEKIYLDTLGLDDYMLANYVHAGVRAPVNLYVAWYDRQRAGEATHSPKACLPGGGWRIDDISQVDLNPLRVDAQPLHVNRVLIQYGEQRQLVYYWFQQRGRIVTNEYLVKWYLLVDSVLKHRTDGALVRLVVPIAAPMSDGDADRELQTFATAIVPHLGTYVPG